MTTMKDDLISRQAAIDALGNVDCSDGVGFRALKYDAINDAVTAIKALPSAQQWIPCNVVLPKESGDYLVTIKREEKQYAVDYLEYNAYGKEWNDGQLFGWTVTAWQPLPQPYREGEKDEAEQ